MNDPGSRPDEELIRAVSAGDSDALSTLLGRHAEGVFDFALRGTLDTQQAAEVTDAVFRRIRERSNGTPTQVNFRPWLYSLGLVEILALANERRMSRISTDDPRFFLSDSRVEPEVAHWAWQAARSLRTRDYCVLDLTLRRSLTPEEVADAASLTRSNLYASIGRARGAFEETFAATLLFERGGDACDALDDLIAGSPGNSLRPALRHQIIEHSDDCQRCRATLASLPAAAAVFVSLTDVALPPVLVSRLLGQVEPEEEPEPVALVTPASAAPMLTFDEPPQTEEVEVAPEPRSLSEDAHAAATSEVISAEDPWARPAAVVPAFPAAESDPAPRPRRFVRGRVQETSATGSKASFSDRVVAWFDGARSQPLNWSYTLLGVATVIAIYLGVAVADSLRGGGASSGAVPLDTTPGALEARDIDCGDTIALAAGDTITLSFDADALDGYEIDSVGTNPDSSDARFEALTATQVDGHSIRFVASQREATSARVDKYQLHINWIDGDQPGVSRCEVEVSVTP